MKRVVTALGAVLAAAAVSAAGPDPAQFKVGVSTVADVEAVYGRPTTESALSTGEHVLVYAQTRARVKATTFIPVIGLFAGGARASSQSVSFVFDKDGKLKSYSDQTTNVDCNSAIVGASCGR